MFAGTMETGMEDNLQETLDKVRGKYGMGAVGWGRTPLQPKAQSPSPYANARRTATEDRKPKVQRFKPGTRNTEPGTRTRS
jgi:hypothetical protein